MSSHKVGRSAGFTLLELLVATAILVVGLGAVMRLIAVSRARSVAASDLAVVQTACRSELARLLAGKEKIAPVEAQRIDGLFGWRLGVAIDRIDRADLDDLVAVRVFGQKFAPTADGSAHATGPYYELLSWVPRTRVASLEHGASGFRIESGENTLGFPDGPGNDLFQGLGDTNATFD